MTAKVFEAALGIAAPWSVAPVDFDEAAKLLTVLIDVKPGSCFAVSRHEGVHPVHDSPARTSGPPRRLRTREGESGRLSSAHPVPRTARVRPDLPIVGQTPDMIYFAALPAALQPA